MPRLPCIDDTGFVAPEQSKYQIMFPIMSITRSIVSQVCGTPKEELRRHDIIVYRRGEGCGTKVLTSRLLLLLLVTPGKIVQNEQCETKQHKLSGVRTRDWHLLQQRRRRMEGSPRGHAKRGREDLYFFVHQQLQR